MASADGTLRIGSKSFSHILAMDLKGDKLFIRMIKVFTTALVLISQIINFCVVPVSANTANIKIKSAQLRNNTLVLSHNSFASIKFKKRIYSDPVRYVFDVLEAELDGGPQTFKLTNSSVDEIRVAQFDPSTVRVVIEAKKVADLEKIKVDNIGQSIYFKFGVQDIVIDNVDFRDDNLEISANGPITSRTILLDNPDRMVLDIIGAKLRNAALKKTFSSDTEQIKVAQFDESTVRIVFTGEKSRKRDLRTSKDEKQLLVVSKEHQKNKSTNKDSSKDKIINISLIKKSRDESVFLVEATKTLEYKFLKLHAPERLVVDLLGISFDDSLIATQFPETDHVKGVRFGIATLGRPVTRLVFDLKEEGLVEEFREGLEGRNLSIVISGIPDNKTKTGAVVPKAHASVGRKVVIDPGHGGYDHGAMYGNHDEKDLTLSIARKIKQYLEDAGISAYMTRTEDRFISLAERVEISNNIDPAVFVSVHANALITNPSMQGLQTYYYAAPSYNFASTVHKQLLDDVKMPDQRVRKAAFWVCRYTQVPSILLELGFMTNVEERKKLASDNYQTELAKSVSRGIIKYLENQK